MPPGSRFNTALAAGLPRRYRGHLMPRRPRLRVLGPLALLLVGGAYALGSANWCGRWEPAPPRVLAQGSGTGPLLAGAASIRLSPPYPVVRAGYGPPRPTVQSGQAPLSARAIVLESGGVKVGLVSIDLLFVPPDLVREIRAAQAGLGLAATFVFATHAHSSFGGYDARLVSELAGTGRERDAARREVVEGAKRALAGAASSLQSVTLELAVRDAPELVASRVPGMAADSRLTRVLLRGAERPVAQLVVFSAHPTLVPRAAAELSPDYPGTLSQELEKEGGVALFATGAVGNASARADKGVPPSAFGEKVAAAAQGAAPVPMEPRLAFALVEATLPRPDASRLVPSLTRAAGDNFLCTSAEHTAEAGILQIGSLRLALVPGEVTWEAAGGLERAARASRVVSVADGYIGYVEEASWVKRGAGESKRQYFGPVLADVLAEALGAGADAIDAAPGDGGT